MTVDGEERRLEAVELELPGPRYDDGGVSQSFAPALPCGVARHNLQGPLNTQDTAITDTNEAEQKTWGIKHGIALWHIDPVSCHGIISDTDNNP